MIKNLPLLLSMLLISLSISLTHSAAHFSETADIAVQLIGAALGIWSVIGLILHIGVQKLEQHYNSHK